MYDIPSACFSKRASARLRPRVKSARVPGSSHSNADIMSRNSSVSSRQVEQTTFGVGRDAYNNVVSANQFNHVPFKTREPGPATYTPDRPLKGRKSCTMRPKTAIDSKFRRLSHLLLLSSSLDCGVTGARGLLNRPTTAHQHAHSSRLP